MKRFYTMMSKIMLLFVLLLLSILGLEAHRRNGVCPWTTYKNSNCSVWQYACSNQKCIERDLLCDGRNDCGDESDEDYCSRCYQGGKRTCGKSNKCIMSYWYCDGIDDCPGGEDERNCDNFEYAEIVRRERNSLLKGINWLYNQSKHRPATEIWGSFVDKSAVVLYSTNPGFAANSNETRKEIAYEVSIQLLSRLFRKKLQDIPSTDLASFVNAMLVSCLDPRKFHGMDIVEELRNRVDQQNYTNPYVLLSLCNAGERMTEADKAKLLDTFWNKRREFWTDMRAMAVMALACSSNQPGSEVDAETLRELTMELKQLQYRNGSVENLQTTALVMQALLAVEPDADPDNFDEGRALELIILNQKPDGSFGTLMNAYYVLPVLNCRSLVNISSDHCQSVQRDETSALDNLAKISGPKKRVQYSLWFGDEKDLERHLTLRVPVNMSFYGIMEVAAEIDSRFRFEYVVRNRKPYVNAVGQYQDNPDKGKFWFLYSVKEGELIPSKESPADVIPKNNEYFVMWYRSGSWVD